MSLAIIALTLISPLVASASAVGIVVIANHIEQRRGERAALSFDYQLTNPHIGSAARRRSQTEQVGPQDRAHF